MKLRVGGRRAELPSALCCVFVLCVCVVCLCCIFVLCVCVACLCCMSVLYVCAVCLLCVCWVCVCIVCLWGQSEQHEITCGWAVHCYPEGHTVHTGASFPIDDCCCIYWGSSKL